jgi:hypothetical protein
MAQANEDTGLGLDSFLHQPGAEASSNGDDPVVATETTEAVEAKPEETPESQDVKTEETPASSPDDKPAEAAPGDTPAAAKPEDTPVAPGEEKKPEEAAPASAVDWDSDSNPYKQRFIDTANWTRQVNQKALDVERQIAILNKKVDGTYDPDKDEPQTSVDDVAMQAEEMGRLRSSLVSAYHIHGKETVDSGMKEFDALFADNDAVQQRVLKSPAPVLEMMKVLREQKFVSKYGADPEKMIANIRAELEPQLRAEIAKEENAKLLERIKNKDDTPVGLGDVRGAPAKDKVAQPAHTPLSQLFDDG